MTSHDSKLARFGTLALLYFVQVFKTYDIKLYNKWSKLGSSLWLPDSLPPTDPEEDRIVLLLLRGHEAVVPPLGL